MTSNYPERIALSNPTHMMSMTDPIANRCGDIKDR